MPGADREYQVIRAFVELSDTLVDGLDVGAVLHRLVGLSVELLAADAAGLLLGDSRKNLRVAAVSSPDAELVELLQLQTGEGPCLDCYRGGAMVVVDDLADAAHRWPRFTHAVVGDSGRSDFRSVHALPLRLRGETLGALNLFHSRPGPLPAADIALGQALADIATIAILHKRSVGEAQLLAEQLQGALDSRVIVEQAKGVLAQRHGIDMQRAFDGLRRYARDGNQRLAEVARQVVDGRLDPAGLVMPSPPRDVDRAGRHRT